MNKTTLSLLARELAGMYEVGLVSADDLRASADGLPRRAEAAMREVASRLENGKTLSEALEADPKSFPSLMVTLVRAGEAGGDVPAALLEMADYLDARNQVVWTFRAAIVYPTLVLFFGTAISGYVTFYLFPRLMRSLSELHALLGPGKGRPWWFDWAITGQRFGFWVLAVLGVVALVVLVSSFVEPRSRWFQTFLLKVPVYRRLFRSYLIFELSGILSVMLRHGVPLAQALDCLQAISGSALLKEAAGKALASVGNGKPASAGLATVSWFPRRELLLLARAEDQERVEFWAKDASESARETVSRSEKTLWTLEPRLVAVVALVVALYLVSVFVPVTGVFHFIALGDM